MFDVMLGLVVLAIAVIEVVEFWSPSRGSTTKVAMIAHTAKNRHSRPDMTLNVARRQNHNKQIRHLRNSVHVMSPTAAQRDDPQRGHALLTC